MRRVLLLLAVVTAVGCTESAGVGPESGSRSPRFALIGGADFWYRCTWIVCEFNSYNWDAQSERWDFGHDASGVGPQVLHTFPAPGTYVVSYTATDFAGNAYTVKRTVNILELTATGQKVRGRHVVDLTWTPANGDIDVFRDGEFLTRISPALNDGSWSDRLGVRGKKVPITYQICDHGTQHCSNFATAWP